EFFSNMESHRQRSHRTFDNMRKNDSQLRAAEWEQTRSLWLSVEAELLRERAVFGPGPGVLLSQDWMQDSIEGPNRTRLRIRRKALRHSKPEPKILCEAATDEEAEEGLSCDRLTFFPALTEAPAVTEDQD
uniref:Uncharacterized protein n=1 Tax=Oryzias latipes TaxID=8090 RepID=A0A3P9LMS9_ORYLA